MLAVGKSTMSKHALASWLVVLMLAAVGCSGPAAPSTATATPLPASRSVSGEISYAGAARANHKIIVVANRVGEQGAPAYSTSISGPGPFILLNVTDSTYNVFAFIDLGDDMGAPKPDEPAGWYDANGDGTPDAVVVQNGRPVTAVNITLRDP